MSSESLPDAFDETNCQCKVCDDILKKPKLLPCLHRFCNDCLESLLENQQDKFQCPECMEEYESSSIREYGLDDDFYMATVIQCIQIRNSLRDGATKECFDCCKHTKMTAYCFKCKDYLCDQCYQHHVNSKILKEHRKHTVIATELEGNQLSLEKCLSLKEPTKCHIHTEAKSQVCCITCRNQPICEACTYGEHMGHNLREVSTRAKSESQNLNKELKRLEEHMKKYDGVRENLKEVRQEVVLKLNEKRNEAQLWYESKISGVKEKIKEVREGDHLSASKVERCKQTYFKYLEREKEREIREIRQRYSNLIKKKKNEYESIHRQYEKRLTTIHQALEKQDEVFQTFQDTLDKNQEEYFQNIQKIEKCCDAQDQISKNVLSAAYLLKSTKDNWLVVQNVPTVCKSIQHFLEKELPNLDCMPEFDVKRTHPFEIVKKTPIFFESKVDIEIIKANSWDIDGITSTADGSIVIAGRTLSDAYCYSGTFLSVINTEGKTLRKNKMKGLKDAETSVNYYSRQLEKSLNYYSQGAKTPLNYYSRYCSMLSEFKVATVAKPDEIGIYDVRDGSYIKKSIEEAIKPALGESESTSNVCHKTPNPQLPSDFLTRRPAMMYYDRSWEKEPETPRNDLTCITADSENNLIFVGYENKDIYVFDDQLNYLYPLKLPDEVRSLQGMVFSNGNLIVCDKQGEKAYAIGLNKSDKSEGHVLLEIPTPLLDSGDWIPQGSVCKDSKGSIYMVWSMVNDQIVVKYSKDGCHILTSKRIDPSALCISTTQKEGTEKLLIVTVKRKEPFLSVYLLDHYDVNSTIKPFMEVLTTNCPELNIGDKTTAKGQAPEALPTKRTEEIPIGEKIYVKGIKANSWVIDGITSTNDGSIVISGRTSGTGYSCNDTFVSVINTEGKTLRKNKMKSLGNAGAFSSNRSRYCIALCDFKIATVAQPDEIGIYDVRDGSYTKKHIDEVIKPALDESESTSNICDKTCKPQRSSFELNIWYSTVYGDLSRDKEPKRARNDLTCITADSENRLIFVGYANKDVYVFSDQLHFMYRFNLPKEINSLHGMTVVKGNLIVSDKRGEKAYVVEMKQSEGRLLREIPTPTLDSGDWIPQGSVCKDSKSFIYIMWSTIKNQIIVKYTEDGRKDLATTRVPKSAFCMTTLQRNDTTDLLVGTKDSKTLQVFRKI